MQATDDLARARPQLGEDAATWLEASAQLRGERFLAAFVGAGRRLGADVLGGDSAFASWPRRRFGRVFLLRALDENAPRDQVTALIHRAYREGDSREKAAVMSALPFLADGQRFVDIAIDCGRTNETDLFASIALGNAFPAREYDDDAFNRLVMKAAFIDFDIAQIVGLEQRANADLARMGMEYIDERQAATRSYPASLWLAIAPANPPGALARMLGELQHAVPERRRAAGLGLALAGDARATSFLRERLEVERAPEVRDVLQRTLNGLEELS